MTGDIPFSLFTLPSPSGTVFTVAFVSQTWGCYIICVQLKEVSEHSLSKHRLKWDGTVSTHLLPTCVFPRSSHKPVLCAQAVLGMLRVSRFARWCLVAHGCNKPTAPFGSCVFFYKYVMSVRKLRNRPNLAEFTTHLFWCSFYIYTVNVFLPNAACFHAGLLKPIFGSL